MATYHVVSGDRGSILTVHISESETQELIDLLGKTVQVRWSLNNGTTEERTMTPLDQVTFKGQASYQFTSADLPTGGTLIGEVRLQDGLPDQLTTVDTFSLAVKVPLP